MEHDDPQAPDDAARAQGVVTEAPTGPPPVEEGTPPPRRWGRRLLLAGLAVIILGFVGYVGLSFLGGQVRSALAGQVQFGTAAPDGCDISQSATEFPAGTALYWGAYLQNDAPAGTTLVIEESKDGQVVGSTEYVTSDTTSCLATTKATAPLAAGTYLVRVLRDTAEEASGTVTLR